MARIRLVTVTKKDSTFTGAPKKPAAMAQGKLSKNKDARTRARLLKPQPIVKEHKQGNSSPKINRIYYGDAKMGLSIFPDKSFDCCLTDPPYNISTRKKGLAWAFSSHVTIERSWDSFSHKEYVTFTKGWLSQVCRIIKENGNIFIFGSYHNIYTIGAIANEMNLKTINSIIWAKPNAQPNITCRMFTESTEQIIWLCNNTRQRAKKWTYNYHLMKKLNGGKQMRNFWLFPVTPMRERKHGRHPSQKPLGLMERLVMAGTNPGDRVIDCFAGTGSTLLACDRLGRDWVGIEQSEEYCEIAYQRLKEDRKVCNFKQPNNPSVSI